MKGRKIVIERAANYLSSALGTDKTEAVDFIIKHTKDVDYKTQQVRRKVYVEENISGKSALEIYYRILLKYEVKYGKGFFDDEDGCLIYCYDGFETDNEKADRIGKSLTYHYRYYIEKKKEKEKINEEIAILKKKLAEL